MRNGLTGQVIVAAGLCVVLALLNIRGIQESARLNIFLAIADLATQALLVVVGVGADPSTRRCSSATCTSAPRRR